MSVWQIALITWAGGGLLVFLGLFWAGSREPTDHGKIILAQFGMIGCLVWPLFLLSLPLAEYFRNDEDARAAIAAMPSNTGVAERERMLSEGTP